MKFLALFAALAAVAVGYPATTTWTLNDLSEVLQNPQTNPALVPYLEAALNEMMEALMTGQQMDTITVSMPLVATYTLYELAEAIQDPNTNPAHLPYLENALDELMAAFYAGEEQEFITVVIPPNLIDPTPEPITVPELVPSPVEVPASAGSSPLVQIIVNVKQQEDVGVAPAPVQDSEHPFIPVRPILPSLPFGVHPRN